MLAGSRMTLLLMRNRWNLASINKYVICVDFQDLAVQKDGQSLPTHLSNKNPVFLTISAECVPDCDPASQCIYLKKPVSPCENNMTSHRLLTICTVSASLVDTSNALRPSYSGGTTALASATTSCHHVFQNQKLYWDEKPHKSVVAQIKKTCH